MREFRYILRQSLPEIVAGLAVAAILAMVSLLYANMGVWSGILIVLIAILAIGCWLLFKRQKHSLKNRSVAVSSPLSAPETYAAKATGDNSTLQIRVDTWVRFDIEAMESMFYRAAKFRHEVGGVLVGKITEKEILVTHVHDGFETAPTNIPSESGEVVVGFWHSHVGFGTRLSSADESAMRTSLANGINVIVDTTSKDETIAAYATTDKGVVKLEVRQP